MKISPQKYEVLNIETGKVHAKHTSLKNAKAQIRLLRAIGGALTGTEVREMSKASYDKSPPEKIGDFVLDRNLSTDEAVVYYNPKTGKASIAHRGSQGVTDWLVNNPALALGYYKYTPRYKRGKENQKKVNEKYGIQNVDTVSHSQSGQLAHLLNEEGLVNKSIEINPARLPFQKIKDNETIIRSGKDIVSSLVPIGRKNGKVETIDTGKSISDILGQHSPTIIQGENENKIYGKGMRNKGKPTIMPINRFDLKKLDKIMKGGKRKMKGGNFFNDIGRAFTGAVNTVADVGKKGVDAVGNVAKQANTKVSQFGDQVINKAQDKAFWTDVGKKTAKSAIQYGVPAVVGALTTATGNPELAPITGALASNFITPQVNKAVGLGRFKKHEEDFYHPKNRLVYQSDTLYNPVMKFHLEDIPRRYY